MTTHPNSGKSRLWLRASAALATVALALSSGLSHAGTKVRTSSFEYSLDGLLQKEIVEPDTPNDCMQTTYGRDSYGNKSTVTLATCTGATGNAISSASTSRVTYYSYDFGRWPTSVTNALSQTETRTYDARFGLQTGVTGPNGLTTTWEYDNFGRKTKETRPDGTYTKWSYLLCTDAGANCPSTVGPATVAWLVVENTYGTSNTTIVPEKRQYHDALDRVVRTQTVAYDGSTLPAATAVQDTEYDSQGRVSRRTQIYALNSETPVYTTYAYDTLGRVLTQSAPDTDVQGGFAVTSFTYSGLTTTVTNSKSQTTTTTKNAQGVVAQVTDNIGGTVTYSYDALGQLTLTNANGSISTIAYNQRGQKTSTTDQAMGVWSYAYNAFGELVSQTDSLGKVTTLAYDTLGRMTQRSEADLVSSWSYDKKFDGTPCGAGVGKLCEAKTNGTYKRTNTYDTLGRLSSTATALDSATSPATVSVAYDAVTGRVQSKTWPTGFSASYQYTPLGYLQKVNGGGSGSFPQTVTLEILSMDPKGNVTLFKQGSQVTTVRNYDTSTGRLRSQSASRAGYGSGGVLNHTYVSDSLGNMVSRNDYTNGVNTQETFSYDGLNRLVMYTALGGGISGTSSTEVQYDSRGNILYKSDVGTYVYDSQRRNRLVSISLAAPANAQIPLSGTRALVYAFDDSVVGAKLVSGIVTGNGNVLSTTSDDSTNNRHTYRAATYMSFNMPSSYTYSNTVNGVPGSPERTLNFVYGPEHQRIRQDVQLSASAPSTFSAGTTWYLHGDDSRALTYEKEIKANGITENRHFLEGAGIVFAVFTSRTGNLGTLPAASTRYLHQDNLGSVWTVTDETGAAVERFSYDAWGKRRNVNGTADPLDVLAGQTTDRGYTLQEEMDEVGLINMNGRVYDPLIGRFLTADPFVQAPLETQSFNRYAYVGNNPLLYTDPTGYFKWSKAFKFLGAIAVAIFAPQFFATYGISVAGMAPALAQTINVMAAGALSSAISAGTVKAAVQGALTAGLFNWAGAIGAEADPSRYVAHAVAGCVSSAANGGKCGSGAASAVFGKFVTNQISSSNFLQGDVAKGVAATVAGGVGSVIAGGKFENGALTAAFGYAFNYCSNGRCTSAFEQAMYDLWPGYKFGTLVYNQTMGDGSWTAWEVVDGVSTGVGAIGKAAQWMTAAGREIQLVGGFYQAEGTSVKFAQSYYEKLWATGRPAPFLAAEEVLQTATTVAPDRMPGFFRITNATMEMVYNPTTKEVFHLQPLGKR